MSTNLRTQPNLVMQPYAQSLQGRLAKLLIASVFYVGRELIAWCRRLVGREPRATAVAIYYHQVPSEQCGLFAKQMDNLMRWAAPIRADRTEPLRCGSRYAMVTADDPWLSFIENALPALESRRIPVTIFAVSDCLGQSMGDPHDRLATEDEISALRSQLVTVGSHTSTHARLTALNQETAWSELRDSRNTLESVLKREVSLFSFPYGAYNDSLINKCRDAGYKRVFVGIPLPVMFQPQEFVIGRIRVDPTDWPLEFRLKVMGAYSWLPPAIKLKRRLVSAVRESLYWLLLRKRQQPDAIG